MSFSGAAIYQPLRSGLCTTPEPSVPTPEVEAKLFVFVYLRVFVRCPSALLRKSKHLPSRRDSIPVCEDRNVRNVEEQVQTTTPVYFCKAIPS